MSGRSQVAIVPEVLPPWRWMRRVYPHAGMPIYRRDREVAAFHEAGHAIFMRWLGVPFLRIELGQDRGAVILDQEAIRAAPAVEVSPESADQCAVQLAAMYVSGRQAEFLLRGVAFPGQVMPADSDHAEARRLLQERFGRATPMGFAQQYARAVLSQSWAEVETLAAHLLQHGGWEPGEE